MILPSISKKRGTDSGKNVENLIKIINKTVNYKDNKNFIKETSKIINLPDKIVERKIKQILFKEFDFKTSSDVEIIPFLYKKIGIKFLNYLNGMFSMVIIEFVVRIIEIQFKIN